jgi:hypothetical protein
VPRLRYIVIVLTGIFAILGIQLVLSIAVSGGAYEIAALKTEMRQSQQQQQIVTEDINALVSPDTLAGLATSMGMVADNKPAYLRLSDAAVLGEAVPASATSGALLYSVTAGTETYAPPAIVSAVYESVAQSTPGDVSATEALAAVSSGPEATPVALATSAPVVTTAAVVSDPPVRFGGTIPSPTTR